jgi:hypothetical protein
LLLAEAKVDMALVKAETAEHLLAVRQLALVVALLVEVDSQTTTVVDTE